MSVIISLIFYKVLAILLILQKKTIILSNTSKLLDFYIINNIKYFFYFENCLSILNNTYLFIHILSIIILLYQNYKSWFSLNILTIYKIDFTFYYILVNWEILYIIIKY